VILGILMAVRAETFFLLSFLGLLVSARNWVARGRRRQGGVPGAARRSAMRRTLRRKPSPTPGSAGQNPGGGRQADSPERGPIAHKALAVVVLRTARSRMGWPIQGGRGGDHTGVAESDVVSWVFAQPCLRNFSRRGGRGSLLLGSSWWTGADEGTRAACQFKLCVVSAFG